MSLIKCKSCNREISDQAKKCPHCNFDVQGEKRIIKLVVSIILVVMFLILFLILMFVKTNESVDVTNSNIDEYFDIYVSGYVNENYVPIWTVSITPKDNDMVCKIATIDMTLSFERKPYPNFPNYLNVTKKYNCILDENCNCVAEVRGTMFQWKYIKVKNWDYTIDDVSGNYNIIKKLIG